MVIIKKYSNRRLYDTEESRYVTLDELAQKVRGGTDVQVVDVKTAADLTQSTLSQIIMESRGAGKLLPVPLLTQLIRMPDDALAEFFGRYLAGALELYVHARQGAQRVAPFFPLAQVPFAAGNAFARLFTNAFGGRAAPPPPRPQGSEPPSPEAPPPPQPAPAAEEAQDPTPTTADEIAQLRRELQEIKDALRSR